MNYPSPIPSTETGQVQLGVALLRELDGLRDALLRPIEGSRRLVDHLSKTIADAERSLNDLGYLFKAEQERVSGKCDEQREKFLSEALPAALSEFHEAIGLRGTPPVRAPGTGDRARTRNLAQVADRWLNEERPVAE